MEATVLATLHPADLFRNPKMKLAVMQDWRKLKLAREGKWPAQVPSYARIPQDAGIEVLEAFVRDAVDRAPFVVVDTEFTRESRFLTVLGMGYPSSTSPTTSTSSASATGVQLWCEYLDPVQRAALRDALKTLFARVAVVFQNSMADIPVLERNLGIRYSDYCRVEDTMLAHAVLWSEWEHTLEFLASVYSKYPKMKHLSSSNPSLYNWGDVVDTICVHEALTEEFRRDPQSLRVYQQQSLRLVPTLLERAALGIRVNKARVKPAVADYQAKIAEANRLALAHVGWPINLGSEKQLKEYLYVRSGYPVQVDKTTKKPSIDGDAIAALRTHVGPVPDLEAEDRDGLSLGDSLRRIDEGADPILEARVMFAAATQIMSHYLAPLVKGNGQLVDRIYPQIKIHAQASGRWSITEPPLQQLPSDLTDIICPDVGEAWIKWDWDQIELRLLAALSGDRPYLDAFSRDDDVHTINACDIFAVPRPPHVGGACPHTPGCVDCDLWRIANTWAGKDDVRRLFAKRFVYRLNYGGDPATAGDIPGARQLGLDRKALIDASNRYLAAHPAMAAWRVEVAAEARTTHMSRTFIGRRRRLLGDGRGAVREAYNHPMQGGVSDILNLVTVQIKNELPHCRLVYTCHDAATWACGAEKAEECLPRIKEIATQQWDVRGVKIAFPAKFQPIKYGEDYEEAA